MYISFLVQQFGNVFFVFSGQTTYGVITLEKSRFMRGVGIGMLAGAVVGMMVSPGKKQLKQTANKAVQAVGNAADTISEAIQH